MICLPEELKHEHREVNEVGWAHMHPGYEVRLCKKCNEEYLCGKGYTGNTCGYPTCGKGKQPV